MLVPISILSLRCRKVPPVSLNQHNPRPGINPADLADLAQQINSLSNQPSPVTIPNILPA